MGWLFKEYIKGELQSTEKVSLNKAYQAAGEAMEYLKFAVTSRQKDVFDGQVIARRATCKQVAVKLKGQSDSFTEIEIREGTLGDEYMAKKILDSMKKYS